MASIYILFPKEHPELVQNASQHFRWAVERFDAMSERNALAKAALGVLQAIHIRLKKSLGLTQQQPPNDAVHSPLPLPSNAGTIPTTGATATGKAEDLDASTADTFSPRASGAPTNGSISGLSNGSANVFTPTAGSDMYSASSASVSAPASVPASGPGSGTNIDAVQEEQQAFDWSLPTDFDWSTIQPIFATGDLVYNDLVGVRDDGSVPQWAADTPNVMDEIGSRPWQFDGDFGNDSVWNLLNLYAPF